METTVADVEGPWIDSEFESSLILRCKNAWDKPIKKLSNEELSTFLRQKIAVQAILPTAKERAASGIEDGTEAWNDELQEAINSATKT